jgi:hypothetical protein
VTPPCRWVALAGCVEFPEKPSNAYQQALAWIEYHASVGQRGLRPFARPAASGPHPSV